MKNSKWVKGVLVVSIALNILVVASIVGFMSSNNHRAPQFAASKFNPNMQEANIMRSFMQGLSRPERRAFGKDLYTAFNDTGLTNDAYAILEANIISQIIAENYNKAQSIAAFHGLYEFNAQRIQLLHEKVLTHFEGLSAEERKEFASGFAEKKRKSKH